MSTPLVSIIIPVYNGSNYLSQAIDSALAQTYKNIEIIVVNDGSKDEGATEKIALSYGDKIKYYAKENGGVSSALNYGIEKMSGEYFSWLSHDDIYLPEKIEAQVNKVRTEKDIILCYGGLMDKDGKAIPYRVKTLQGNYSGQQMFNKFIKGYGLNGLGFLIPRECFIQVGKFDESMRYLQDLDLWLQMMWLDYRFICHKDQLVVSRIHREQVTNRLADVFFVDRTQLAKKHIELLKQKENLETIPLLKLYLLFFYKADNKEGICLVKKELKNKTFNKSIYLACYAYKVLGKIRRLGISIKNFLMKGFRKDK